MEPPAYAAAGPSKKAYGSVDGAGANANEPLLPGDGDRPRDAWGEDGEELEEDFKIGVTVSQSAIEIRQAFVRKVYGVLFLQVLATTLVGWAMQGDAVVDWTHTHPGLIWIPMIGSFVSMFGVYFKARSSPTNIVLLGVFTMFEAVTIGSIVSYYDTTVVLQAFVATTFVFAGLTLFTFQSKYDFSHWGSSLFVVLLAFTGTTFISLLLPYNSTVDMFMAGTGVLLFSAYIVYDTHLITKRLHVDDWVLGCVSLYIDIVNLFLQLLRLFNDMQDR